MIRPGKRVLFRLTEEGERALAKVFSGPFEADVLATNTLGVWVSAPSSAGIGEPELAVLIRWNHIATALTEWRIEPGPARSRAGFKP